MIFMGPSLKGFQHGGGSNDRLNRCFAALLTGLLVVLPVSMVQASYLIPTAEATATIDGDLSEPLWDSALAITLDVETSPGENTAAPVKTTAFISRNNEYLYIGFMVEDPGADKIRASFRDRDTLISDDWAGVSLDTFNDERRSYEFYVNPFGSQMDAIYNDVLRKTDPSWDAIWYSAGKVTDSGYQVEIAIPFKSLRFPSSEEQQTWGIKLIRHYPRNVRHHLSDSPVNRSRNCKLCQYTKFSLQAIAPNDSKNIEITPSLVLSRSDARIPPGPDWRKVDTGTEPGLDISWNINTQNVLALTLNPDFSQVESDALQLDVNTPFALYYPEKRAFFLEGTDYFQTSVPTVFTRNVIDPDAGLKLTGKYNRHMYAAFVARDAVTSFIIPGPLYSSVGVIHNKGDSGVGRYRYDLGETSTIGVLATLRQSGDYYNRLLSIDGRYVINQQHSINYQLMESETRYPSDLAEEFDQPLGSFGGHGTFVRYEFKNRNWHSQLRYRNYSDGLRADMGFLSRVGYERKEFYTDRYFYGDEDNWWHTIRAHVNWTITHDSDNNMIRRGNELAVEVRGPLQSILYLNHANLSEFWDGVLYDEAFLEFYAEIRTGKKWIFQLSTVFGDEIDLANNRLADSANVAFWIQYIVSDHLSISTDFAFTELEYKNNRILTAFVNDLRVIYQFNLKHRLELTLQLQSTDKNQAMYNDPIEQTSKYLASRLVYSYKVNPRTVIYAGYSDNAIANDTISSLTRTERTAFLKLSYGFDI
jgi:hypothetical protein